MLKYFISQTPLHYAAAAENADMAMEILLNEGATPNSKVKFVSSLP
jgi:ankyrin repeat protein